MGGIPNAVADALAAEVRKPREWDGPPGLYVMYVNGGRCRLEPVPLRDAIWARMPASEVPARLAAAGPARAGLLQRAAEPGLYGAALLTEGYWVQAPMDDHAAVRTAIADGNAHQVKARPDRVEIRQIWAVDRASITYWARLERPTGAVQSTIYPPQPGKEPVGAEVDGLDQLVSALLGVRMPDRSLDIG
jgi:hypothetical protein